MAVVGICVPWIGVGVIVAKNSADWSAVKRSMIGIAARSNLDSLPENACFQLFPDTDEETMLTDDATGDDIKIRTCPQGGLQSVLNHKPSI